MIRELYAKHFSERVSDRDNISLHVSDLGDCSRAVWARRNGKDLLSHDDDTQRKFDMGNDVEDRVGAVLSELEEYAVERQYVHDLEIRGDHAEGHSDFVCRSLIDPSQSFIVEVKSTTFYPKVVGKKRVRVAPTASEVQWHYRLQAASYALEQGFARFVLVIVCRESGMMAEHWYKTADYADAVRAALKEKALLTRVGAPMPDAAPPAESFNYKGESWRCKYCPFTACERNENPAALAVAL